MEDRELVEIILKKDGLVKKIMEARLNNTGITLSASEVHQICSAVLVGTIYDEVLNTLLFDNKYGKFKVTK